MKESAPAPSGETEAFSALLRRERHQTVPLRGTRCGTVGLEKWHSSRNSGRWAGERPPTFWPDVWPTEYGFYSNVNPGVRHPRWSQARERPLGELLEYIPPQLFNGYAEYVGDLYDPELLTYIS